MVIDGRALAHACATQIREGIEKCDHTPTLGILMVAPTPETLGFVGIKEKKAAQLGISVVSETLSETSTTEEVLKALEDISKRVDGVVVQQPMPSHIDIESVCEHILPEKDIDALRNSSPYVSPVVGAITEIVAAHDIELSGVPAVVLGAGKLVGAPTAAFLKEARAEVTVMTKETGVDSSVLKAAKFIVSGTGRAGLITKDMVSPDAVVIDAGTSESRGALRGDVDPSVYEYARLVSPVPGGVGPLTVTCLFKNLMKSASCSL